MKRVVWLLLIAVLYGQEPPKGSISGTMVDDGTGQPIANGTVGVSLTTPGRRIAATTDAQGRFTLSDVAPGTFALTASTPFVQGQGFPVNVSRIVTLAAGQKLESIQLRMRQNGRISGQVVDQNDEPVPGMNVLLISREYQLGELRYIFSSTALTDDEGRYTIQQVVPGRSYILMAGRISRQGLKTISDAPLDVSMRRPAYTLTYYPNVPVIEGAQLITLRAAEHRENMDLRIQRTASYCATGSINAAGATGAVYANVVPASPHSGQSGNGGLYMGGGTARVGTDGRVRFCDLSPDRYKVIVNVDSNRALRTATEFTIKDQDVAFQVTMNPAVTVKGDLTWATTPPETFAFTPPTNWSVQLDMLSDASPASVPLRAIGPFEFAPLPIEDFWLTLATLPPDTYIRELSYGSRNLMLQPFRPGSAVGDQGVRIVLGRDGGRVRVKVADDDGKPSPDHYVTLVPVTVRSEIEFADMVAWTGPFFRNATLRQTDQNGAWTSPQLAPGKYYVYAASSPFDRTPETVAKYWQARGKVKQVEVSAGGTVDAAVTPLQ